MKKCLFVSHDIVVDEMIVHSCFLDLWDLKKNFGFEILAAREHAFVASLF